MGLQAWLFLLPHRLMRTKSILATVLAAMALTAPAHAWFGPSEQKPYELHAPDAVPSDFVSWTWQDRRTTIRTENQATKDGYALADTVFRPRPAAYLQAEFAQQVMAHAERDAIAEKLRGQTIELLQCEIDVGLWLRLGERQSGKWETVRVYVRIRIDGQTFEALETQPFKSGAAPSPAADPMRAAASSLVEQIHQFL